MKCVITGGSKGIGLAIARAMVRSRFEVFIVARSASTLDSAVKELQSEVSDAKVHHMSVDVRSRQEITDMAMRVKEAMGGVDVLINNAGTFTPGSIVEEPDGTLELMIETNLYSAYYVTKRLYPMIEQSDHGHIINISSIAGVTAYPNGGAYGISKFAMQGFSKNLRSELMPKGIRVTSVLPGATWTASWEGSGVERDRIMEADDIAEAVMSAIRMGPKAVVEEVIVRPQLGDL